MRLDDQKESGNIEDRRGMGSRGGGFSIGRGRLGIGTIVVALAASYFLGIDPLLVLGVLTDGAPPGPARLQEPARRPPADDQAARFVAKVLGSTEETWREIFSENHARYEDPGLVLFSGVTPTACGTGQSAMGPFYCPADRKVYLDLSFFRELKERFHSPGEFAEAYVIAHEVGHHVQNLLGISDQVREMQRSAGPARANALSVRLELQADCFAGVWGHRADAAKGIIEPGEVEQALTAASAIGDDHLQRQTQGRVVPESFTHGTSAQRVRWFRRGLASGDLRQCDTFGAASP
ncbi:MAG: neutral zinc metallopeptidase [Candidatus Accumulibacter sp.]|jgi:predicted metalloprotease|nr:neutral zinc metallopeptidase [Accumulibacter sp.]